MRKSAFMSPGQAALRLGESISTIMRRIEAGTLAAEKIEGVVNARYLVDRADVERLAVERAAELRREAARLEAAAS